MTTAEKLLIEWHRAKRRGDDAAALIALEEEAQRLAEEDKEHGRRFKLCRVYEAMERDPFVFEPDDYPLF